MTNETENEAEQTAEMKIRLPVKLRRQIEGAAEDNRRKMNAEIVARLMQTFPETAGRTTVPVPDHDKRLSSVEAAVLGIMDELETVKERLAKLEK